MINSNLSLTNLELRLAKLRSEHHKGAGQLELLETEKANLEQREKQLTETLGTWLQVQTLFGKVSEYSREQLKIRIERTVTAALQAIIGEEGLAFEIALGERNNVPTAEWQVSSLYGDEVVTGRPEDSRGGGIVDVVSLALRLALLELVRPENEGPLLLDEVGKHVSERYAPNVAHFLKEYARKTGRQIILVTHQEALAEVADQAIKIGKIDGESVVLENG